MAENSMANFPRIWISRTLLFALFSIMLTTGHTSPSLDFSTFENKARSGGDLSVVFLGGSLTWGAQSTNPQETSYRALVGKKLIETFSKAHFQFGDAAIGGTGSQLAAFRLDRKSTRLNSSH